MLITRRTTLESSEQLDQLDDTVIEDESSSQALLDCVVLARCFFELEALNLRDLDNENKGLFAHWNLPEYVDQEVMLFMLLDYCLYPRRPVLSNRK